VRHVAGVFVANPPPTDTVTTIASGSFLKKPYPCSTLWQNHGSLGILSLLKEKKIVPLFLFLSSVLVLLPRTEILV
jgi:hypothetical protein